ncbi:hypothetical protein Avbf_17039 [Armadillidium vulgare]|nr:hypothetical protein Avbf_17039 [Armadillidium vulgare]
MKKNSVLMGTILLAYCILNVICLIFISLHYIKTASNKYSIIEGKTLYCRLKSKPYQRKIIPHYLTHL